MDPRIADYIRANRRKYTREALTRQLVEAGHDPDEIERVWAAFDAPDADDVAGEGFWGRFALLALGINVGVLLIVGYLTGMLQNLAGGSVVTLVVLGVALAIGALIAWGIVAATGPARLSPRVALGIGVAIPLLFALLIGGSCYALLGSIGGIAVPAIPATIEAELGPPLGITQVIDGSCQPNGPDPADGFSVYGTLMSETGQMLDISVGAYPPGRGAPLATTLWIASSYVDKAEERHVAWGNEGGGPSDGEVDVALTGMDGTATFTDLPAMQGGPADPLGEPLSGEIRWTCE